MVVVGAGCRSAPNRLRNAGITATNRTSKKPTGPRVTQVRPTKVTPDAGVTAAPTSSVDAGVRAGSGSGYNGAKVGIDPNYPGR